MTHPRVYRDDWHQEIVANEETIDLGSVNAKRVVLMNSAGSITGGFAIPEYDYVTLTEAALTDTWVFKTGGVGGSTVATITITYTSTTKGTISTVAKT